MLPVRLVPDWNNVNAPRRSLHACSKLRPCLMRKSIDHAEGIFLKSQPASHSLPLNSSHHSWSMRDTYFVIAYFKYFARPSRCSLIPSTARLAIFSAPKGEK